MKRSKFLALVLVVAVMMMGAGYAYWTQDLTIDNTITTGKLEVVFDDATLGLEVDEYMDATTESTFVPATEDGSHALVMNLVDAYPGANVDVSFDLVNEGTMAANVRGFAIADGAVKADLVLCRSLSVDDIVIDLEEDSTLADALAELNDYNTALEPEEAKKVEMTLEIDPAAENDDLEQDTANAINFTITATAYQYNDSTN
jgi:predicted ribosomally synthesized peptide with SipW-like signal peptide